MHVFMSQIIKVQVQLARQEVAKNFNTDVVDDMEITVNLLTDLRGAEKKAVKSFKRALKSLTPGKIIK